MHKRLVLFLVLGCLLGISSDCTSRVTVQVEFDARMKLEARTLVDARRIRVLIVWYFVDVGLQAGRVGRLQVLRSRRVVREQCSSWIR